MLATRTSHGGLDQNCLLQDLSMTGLWCLQPYLTMGIESKMLETKNQQSRVGSMRVISNLMFGSILMRKGINSSKDNIFLFISHLQVVHIETQRTRQQNLNLATSRGKKK